MTVPIRLRGVDGDWTMRFEPTVPAHGSVTLATPRHVVAPGDVLEYDYRPAEGVPGAYPLDADGGHGGHTASGVFAATAAAVVPVFDTESPASSVLRDQHGVALTARDQGRSRTLRVDEWNHKAVDLTPVAGSLISELRLSVESLAGEPSSGRIRGVRVGRPRRSPGAENISATEDPLAHVETRRGTNSTIDRSRGNTVPAVAVPGGFALTFPVTQENDDRWPYAYGDPGMCRPFHGFRVGHTPTPWLGDYGMLQVGVDDGDGVGTFTAHDERARPDRYEVVLSSGTTAEASPTAHGVILRFRTSADASLRVRAFAGGLSHTVAARGVQVIRGYSDFASDMLAGAPRVHFWIEVDGALGAAHVEEAPELRFGVDPAKAEVIVRVGTSLIDEAHAERNGRATGGIDDAARRAGDAWRDVLGEFVVKGASADQTVSLYSSLYRMFLYPSVAHEVVDGRPVHGDIRPTDTGSSDGTVPLDGPLTVSNGFWDTYRTLWPAYALLAPDRAAALLDGFVMHFQESGWMPRWSAPHAIDIMVGTSSDIVFADAIIKGVPLADDAGALRSALKNATVESGDPAVGRKGLLQSLHLGYTPASVPESVSWTLEGAINDFGILALLERSFATGRREFDGIDLRALIDWFRHRAAAHMALFDPVTRFYRPRTADGDWYVEGDGFEPRRWGGAYTETNAWGMRFSAPHDGHALAALYGGPDELEHALDEYFGTAEILDPVYEGSYGRRIHEMVEARDVRMGMFALSNQPAHHVPYMYAFTRAAGKTAPLVRAALRTQFLGSDLGQGYPGDEDNGEMSAWYLFGALGLYPLAVGTPWYVVTAPLFPTMEVPTGRGRLRVTRDADRPGADHIAGVTVDGVPLEGPFIHHDALQGVRHIHVSLTDEAGAWGSGPHPPGVGLTPQSETPRMRERKPPLAVTGTWQGACGLADVTSVGCTAVPAGASITWEYAEPMVPEMLVVTGGEDPAHAPRLWRLEACDDGEAWREVDRGSFPSFTWPVQTLPVIVDAGHPHRFYRLHVDDRRDTELRMLSLLVSVAMPSSPPTAP